MKVKLGIKVQHRITGKIFTIDRIHPYAKEIELTSSTPHLWDFQEIEDNFVDSIENYKIILNDSSLHDITGFQITTENYIVS